MGPWVDGGVARNSPVGCLLEAARSHARAQGAQEHAWLWMDDQSEGFQGTGPLVALQSLALCGEGQSAPFHRKCLGLG